MTKVDQEILRDISLWLGIVAWMMLLATAALPNEMTPDPSRYRVSVPGRSDNDPATAINAICLLLSFVFSLLGSIVSFVAMFANKDEFKFLYFVPALSLFSGYFVLYSSGIGFLFFWP